MDGADSDTTLELLEDLHKSFANLSQEEQKYAKIFLRDVERGDADMEEGKRFRDYVTEYQERARNDEIHKLAETLGLDEPKLRHLMGIGVSETTINAFGRLDELERSVDGVKAKAYFEEVEGQILPPFKVSIRVHNLLKDFILKGGFEVNYMQSSFLFREV